MSISSIVATLFKIRTCAHDLHLSTKSFAAHMALGDFYDALIPLSDNLSETHFGKYGLEKLDYSNVPDFACNSPVEFIASVSNWAEQEKAKLPANDSFILNIWDEITALIYKTKYKLENLS